MPGSFFYLDDKSFFDVHVFRKLHINIQITNLFSNVCNIYLTCNLWCNIIKDEGAFQLYLILFELSEYVTS